MNRRDATAVLTAAMVAAVIVLVAAPAAFAGSAPAGPATSLQQAVRQGAWIFAHDRFGGTRIWTPDMAFKSQPMTCQACHTNGGRTEGTMPSGGHLPSLIGAGADFPKYVPRKHEVFTLQRQLVHCIRAGLGGKAPPYDSPQMVDLTVYLDSLSKGVTMGRQFKSR